MARFVAQLSILPPPQRKLWPELSAVPQSFTLYGGTALALRLAHRSSIDFDFFSNENFDPDRLTATLAFLRDSERVRVEQNTLSCRLDRGGPVFVSFFGGLGLGQVAPADEADNVSIASLLDLAGTKLAVVQKRAEEKDYLDIDAILLNGVDLPTALAAGIVVYGEAFNPLISLKALCYFGDIPGLPEAVRQRLATAAASVDVARLPELAAYRPRKHP